MLKDRPRNRVVISLSVVWSVRNVLCSGLFRELEKYYDVSFIVPEHGVDTMRAFGIPASSIISLTIENEGRLEVILRQILEADFVNRKPLPENAVLSRVRKLRGLRNVSKLVLVKALAKSMALVRIQPIVEKVYEGCLAKKINRQDLEKLTNLEAISFISTACVGYFDHVVFAALRRNTDARLIAHVLSFDNPSSRGYLPLRMYDRFLVWGDQMRKDLEELQDVPSEKMIITGTPQFDFHVEFMKENPGPIIGQRYFLYAANHVMHTPTEPQLVAAILEKVRAEKDFDEIGFKVRLHPMDDYQRWNWLKEKYPNIEIEVPWKQGDGGETSWGTPNRQEVFQLSKTIHQSVAVMGIASTSLVDAVIMRRPAIGIGFDVDGGGYSDRYRDFHFTYHYKFLTNGQFVKLAEGLNDLIETLKASIAESDSELDERATRIQGMTGPLDGKAADRISEQILNEGF